MFGLGVPELVVIMFLVLIIFGAGKLPEIGGAIGKGIKGFRGAVAERDGLPPTETPKEQGKA